MKAILIVTLAALGAMAQEDSTTLLPANLPAYFCYKGYCVNSCGAEASQVCYAGRKCTTYAECESLECKSECSAQVLKTLDYVSFNDYIRKFVHMYKEIWIEYLQRYEWFDVNPWRNYSEDYDVNPWKDYNYTTTTKQPVN